MKVFVSHATLDDTQVTRLHDLMQAAGLDPWVDHKDKLTPGTMWDDEIQAALNDSAAGVVVLSPDSANRREVMNEWSYLIDLTTPIYVALLADVPIKDYPYRLKRIQRADLTRDFEKGAQDLIAAILGKKKLDGDALPATSATISGVDFPRSLLDLAMIGRDGDRRDVEGYLAAYRVTLIKGLGGLGKTRLAADIAANSTFRDGVVWHRVKATSKATDLTNAIRAHLGLSADVSDDDVWNAVGRRQILIVVDNAEDCTDPDERQRYLGLFEQYDLSGGSRILVTSREQWKEM